jgi:hypothetical protein
MDESQNPWQASLGGASLLKAHGTTSNPAKGIVDAAVAGTFTAKSLTDLITEAAQRQLVANYRQELRARSERMFVEQFHRSLLKNGGADAILDSLRPSFDTAAEAIAAARDVIPTEAPAEEFLRIAQPAALAVWQGLDEHLSVIDRIGRIAAQFGPRNGNFPSSRSTRSATDSGSRIAQSGVPTAPTSNQTPTGSASPTAGTAHHRGFEFPCG